MNLWRTKILSIDRKLINSLAFSILQSHYSPTEGLRSVPSYSSWTALYRCWPFPDTWVELNTLKQPWLTCSKMNTSTWKTWVYVRLYCPFFFNYTVSEWGGQVSKMTPQVNITLKWMIFSEQLIFQSLPHPKLQKMYIEVCKLYEPLL